MVIGAEQSLRGHGVTMFSMFSMLEDEIRLPTENKNGRYAVYHLHRSVIQPAEYGEDRTDLVAFPICLRRVSL